MDIYARCGERGSASRRRCELPAGPPGLQAQALRVQAGKGEAQAVVHADTERELDQRRRVRGEGRDESPPGDEHHGEGAVGNSLSHTVPL